MSDEQSDDKKQIKTSALDQDVVGEINRRLFLIEKIKSTKIRRSSDEPKKEDVEELPLPEVDSLIGFATQGDAYHNDLELLHDRIKGEASAPEFVAPRLQVEEEEQGDEPELHTQRTPSPFDIKLEDEGDDGALEALFGETSGAVSFEGPGGATEELVIERDPSPAPQILGGVTLSSLDELQSTLATQEAQARQASERIVTQETAAEDELIIQVNEEADEDEEWALDDLKGLMGFDDPVEGGEALEGESTVADADPTEGDA